MAEHPELARWLAQAPGLLGKGSLEEREKMARALLGELIEAGPREFAMRSLAARMQVSVGSLYNRVGTREASLEAAGWVAGVALSEALRARHDALAALPFAEALLRFPWGGEPPGEDLERLFSHYLSLKAARVVEVERVFTDAVREALLDGFRLALAASMARGETRADVDFDAVCRLSLAVAEGAHGHPAGEVERAFMTLGDLLAPL